ncbi:RNA polymerase sigma factor [Paracoccus sp. MC1862]|uniref:RNA polymerase sigma factor n=1 Tax=Paracoccus sp. MC1862 TaxID=2760307 RepID=UPI001603B6E0|nr:RNA polymerase sigma factor [Paracoccus sp. MC1862]MBB1499646.1 RNA polymerase sigma factor [Paracoccus sp. MC1862]QQO45332.1 RNA polymerase sigma factor [Paracoccus sp. MC1862]
MSEPERSVSLRAERQSSEAALVAAARLHDEAAVRELIRRLNGRLFRIARGLMPSDAEAEEVVQDAWLAAFTHLDGFRDAARFSTWITRITLNCAAMRLRKQQARQEYDTVNEPVVRSAEVLLFPGTDPQPIEAILGRMQTRALIEAAVGELPPDLRLVFLMHEAVGLSLGDIARDLSLPLGTVKTRLMRARHRLRRIIADRIKGGFETIFPFAGDRCAHMADRVVAMLKARPCWSAPLSGPVQRDAAKEER